MKNQKLKTLEGEMTGYLKMYHEFGKEVKDAKKNAKLSEEKKHSIDQQKATLHQRLNMTLEELRSFKDEIRNQVLTASEMQKKFKEYEEVNDIIHYKYEERETEFSNIIACIDDHYKTEVSILSEGNAKVL